jgi:hypothetical protein
VPCPCGAAPCTSGGSSRCRDAVKVSYRRSIVNSASRKAIARIAIVATATGFVAIPFVAPVPAEVMDRYMKAAQGDLMPALARIPNRRETPDAPWGPPPIAFSRRGRWHGKPNERGLRCPKLS